MAWLSFSTAKETELMDYCNFGSMKQVKKIIFALITFFFSLSVCAQDSTRVTSAQSAKPAKQGPSFAERLFFGGNLGLSFGSLTYVNVSPIVGYRFSEKFGAGLGPAYSYFSDNRDKNYKYSTNTYGGRLFGQYLVMDNLMLYSEYELINIEVPDLLYTKLIRENVSSLFVGGGYMQRFGNGNSGVSLMLLYNIMESDYNIYQNPIIRTGFNFGF